MFRFNRPQSACIQQLLQQQIGQPLSYSERRASLQDELPGGYFRIDCSYSLGHGEACFARSTEALERWTCFKLRWVRVVTDGPPDSERVYALVVRIMGCWFVNCCRVVEWDPGLTRPNRWRLVVGTTPHHVASGEEQVSVEMMDDGEVIYRIRSFSRPNFWLTRATPRLMRRKQHCFCRDSRDAMLRYNRAVSTRPVIGNRQLAK